jgi:hypothetical protein
VTITPIIFSALDVVRIFTHCTPPREQMGICLIRCDEHGEADRNIMRLPGKPPIGTLEEAAAGFILMLAEPDDHLIIATYRQVGIIHGPDPAAWSQMITAALTRKAVLIDWLDFDDAHVTSHAQWDKDTGLPDRWLLLSPKDVSV